MTRKSYEPPTFSKLGADDPRVVALRLSLDARALLLELVTPPEGRPAWDVDPMRFDALAELVALGLVTLVVKVTEKGGLVAAVEATYAAGT